MERDEEQLENDEFKTYEVGFLLSPLIPAEAVPEAIDRNFKNPIVAAGGEIIGELPIRSLALAYPIRKAVGNKRVTFKEAFLGSLRFLVTPALAVRLGTDWFKQPELIRHLLIEITKSDLAYEKRLRLQQKRVAAESVASEVAPVSNEANKEEGEIDLVAVNEAKVEVIDREIDQLLSS